MALGKRVVLIAENPRAGAADAAALIDGLEHALQQRGFAVQRERDPETIRCRLEAASATGEGEPLACVVCAGGDGTVGMVANWARPSLPLAVLPLGTENLLARQLGFNRDVGRLSEQIARGSQFTIDAGEANGRMFLSVASLGFDAEVARLVASRRTGHIRHSTWLRPIAEALWRYRYPPVRMTTSSGAAPVIARWAFVLNLPRYALGLQFVADGDPADGQLDVCCFRRGQWWNGVRYLAGVLFGGHRTWRDTHVERATWLRFEADEPVPYQLDGDPGGSLPLEIRVLPGRVTIIGELPA
jgi:diacylglycerol kinase family enzyme